MTSEELRKLDVEIHRKVMGHTCEYLHRTPHDGSEDFIGCDFEGWYERIPTSPNSSYPQPVPRYSSDIAAAFEIAKALSARGLILYLLGPSSPDADARWQAAFTGTPRCSGVTAPRAICRAALKAITPEAA